MPVDVSNALETLRQSVKATLSPGASKALGKYADMMQQEMGGFAKRRTAERALADYVKNQVVPVAMGHEKAKLEEISNALATCRSSGEHGIVVDSVNTVVGKQVAWVSKCGLSKLCPDESQVEGRRVAERYLPAVTQWVNDAPPGVQRRVFYAVATEPNYPVGTLHDGKRASFKRLSNMLERIRHTKSTRDRVGSVVGVLAVQEDPLSGLGTWNGHLNLIILVEGHFDYAEFRAEWGFNVEIKHLPLKHLASAFLEVCKYQAKAVSMGDKKDGSTQPGMVDWPPSLWLEWWRANNGFRRTRSYGVLFGIPKPEKPLDLCKRIWMGRVSWTGTKYRVEYYVEALQYVDLIQGDKSGILRPKPPKKRHRKRAKSPPGVDDYLNEMFESADQTGFTETD